MERLQGISCPRCSYQAVSLLDLESHGRDVHSSVVERLFPFQGRQELQTVQPPQTEVALGTGHSALAVPEVDTTFWIEERVLGFLHTVGERSSRGGIVNILVVGPTGSGKSSLPKEFAATWRRPFFTMHCQLVTEQDDWWGTREVSAAQGTYFRKAALVNAVETPGCVILLDEANRTHPENLNALFGFLDHRRRAWVPPLHREVSVAPGVVFFVTLNQGAEYVGTNPVDRALMDRISNTLRMEYPPKKVETKILTKRTGIEEEMAGKLVGLASTVRGNPKLSIMVSTRQLLECAALVKERLPFRDAVMFSIVNGAPDDMERGALLQALQMSGGVDEAYVQRQWDDEE